VLVGALGGLGLGGGQERLASICLAVQGDQQRPGLAPDGGKGGKGGNQPPGSVLVKIGILFGRNPCPLNSWRHYRR
jgi:hypothetical protein